MPSSIPVLPKEFIQTMDSLSFQEIAYAVGSPFFLEDLPEDVYRRIIDESFTFDVPIVQIEPGVWVMELFHGPTLAFKDFAARFMARLMAYYARQRGQHVTVLVATSGDTGSAVAHGFLGINTIDVVILYPRGKVSDIQEQQLTTMGQNITALEVDGTFDDCQRMVKQAFLDPDLTTHRQLASANSINIARLLPQSFYYVYASSRLRAQGLPIVMAVPSGNVGNLTAGLIAKRMGAPIDQFIAATNANDTVVEYLRTSTFQAKPSVATLSNAMDVGNPSNFVRMFALYGHDVEAMRRDLVAYSFSDAQTKAAMAEVYHQTGYIMDPHGAVGYLALQKYRETHRDSTGVFLETAHPAKFGDIVEKVIGKKVPMPERLQAYADRTKKSIRIGNQPSDLKEFLLSSSQSLIPAKGGQARLSADGRNGSKSF